MAQPCMTPGGDGAATPKVALPSPAPDSRRCCRDLMALEWPDSSPRWSPARTGTCFHCSGNVHVRRNICGTCRKRDTPFLVPRDPASDNVFVQSGGYRWCQRHCSTLPKPLSAFSSHKIKKCAKCVAGRAQAKKRQEKPKAEGGAPRAKRPRTTKKATPPTSKPRVRPTRGVAPRPPALPLPLPTPVAHPPSPASTPAARPCPPSPIATPPPKAFLLGKVPGGSASSEDLPRAGRPASSPMATPLYCKPPPEFVFEHVEAPPSGWFYSAPAVGTPPGWFFSEDHQDATLGLLTLASTPTP